QSPAFAAISGAGTLTKTSTGTLLINSIRAAGLSIADGTVKITGGLGDSSTSVLNSLPSIAAGGFDLNDSKLIIQFGTNASPVAAARTSIIAGRGGTDFANGDWNGAGGI